MGLKRLVLDVDTGTDDAVALMVAALAPELELVGVTTVNGNCSVEIATENTLRVLDHIGAKVPVFQGAPMPLLSTLDTRRRWDIFDQGLSLVHGDLLELPSSHSAPQPYDATSWLIETYMESAGDITLVAVGPLTNVALAIRQEPRILEKIPELIIMGGGHLVNSNPSAEFNIWVDPEAARIVLGCGRPIRLVTLDATHGSLVTLQDVADLRELGTPAATATAAFVERRIRGYAVTQPDNRPGAAPVHDALAVCGLIAPEILTTEFLHVDVEVRGELTAGRTVIDTHHRSGRQPNVHVALAADEEQFVALLKNILGRAPVQD